MIKYVSQTKYYLTLSFMLGLLVSSCGPSAPSRTRLQSIGKDIKVKEALTPLKNMSEFKNRFLLTTNDIRRRYGLDDLTWDDTLASYAQRWADYLRDNDKCLIAHRSTKGITEGKRYGENLALYWTSEPVAPGAFVSSPEFANLGWSQECEDYDYDTTHCTPHKKCGHFTQVVWQATKKIGCAVAVCDGTKTFKNSGRAEVWVCNYDPPGNVVLIDPRGNQTPERPF